MKKNRNITPKFMGVRDAATYLDVSDRSIRRYAKAGDLKHHRVGGLIKFRPEALEEYAREFFKSNMKSKNN